ncbi:TniQ family protein [Amylibacter sp. SFDW26]|uniref:TniQ family protein n=1 Tax=Amylibacter sp. SFDW26 TaxID=2652722 RepID=UPI00186A87AB|nr:TniQ family protein [Amylibacter sp. SFDW26]
MQTTPKRLPILFKTIRGEVFSSFVGRNACFYDMDANSFLMEVINDGAIGEAYTDFDFCDHQLEPIILKRLPNELNTTKNRLLSLTLSHSFSVLSDEELRYSGGVSNIDTYEDLYSGPLKHAWCGRCLMEDQSKGRDQYMRLLWSLGTNTFCPKHRLPLTSHCLNCFDRAAKPQFAYDGKQSVIICSRCGANLGSQLGLQNISDRNALGILSDRSVKMAWNAVVRLENTLRRSLASKITDKRLTLFRTFIIEFSNILLKSSRGYMPMIEHFSSAAFPNRPDPANVMKLHRPYRATSVATKRKTHALIVALLKGCTNLFTARAPVKNIWSRAPTMQNLRDEMSPGQNSELDALFVKFPASAF